MAAKDDDETHDIREAHGYGYHGNYAAFQAKDGLQIWDWSDIHNPTRLSYLELPGIGPGDYTNANWWTFWQALYIYVGGANQGIFIIRLIHRIWSSPSKVPSPILSQSSKPVASELGHSLQLRIYSLSPAMMHMDMQHSTLAILFIQSYSIH